jgi:hypothetical protein
VSLRISDGEAEASERVGCLWRRWLRRWEELEAGDEGAAVGARGPPQPPRRQEDAGDAEAKQNSDVSGGPRGRHA